MTRGYITLGCLALLSGPSVAGCSFSERIADHAIEYNKTIEQVQNAQILLNILRARDRHPMHFSSIAQIRGSLTRTTSSGLSLEIPFGGDAVSSFPLTPSLEFSETTSPSFDLDPLNTKEFTSGILSPIDSSVVKYYWDQRWPQQILLYAFVHKVEEEIEAERYTYVNAPQYDLHGSDDAKVCEKENSREKLATNQCYFSAFKKWVDDVYKRIRIAEIDSGRPIGPAVELKTESSLRHLVEAEEQGLRLVPIGGAYRLCKVTNTLQFCIDECPEDTVKEQCRAAPSPNEAYSPAAREPALELPQPAGQMRVVKGPKTQKDPKISIHLRSVQGIIYYLGELIRYESNNGTMLKINYGGYKEKRPFFTLTEYQVEADKPHISVDYAGTTYYVPKEAGKDRNGVQRVIGGSSKTVLSLVTQLLGLYRKREELPTTTAVQAVGGS